MSKNIALIIGSLRKDSINRLFAQYICNELEQSNSDLNINEIRLDDLPIYNQDFDSQNIDSYNRVRQQIKQADAVLVVTPEHNRTIPAALKNIIDIASRPSGENLWSGKKIAVVTASPGSFGGISATIDFRKIMQVLGAHVLIKPDVQLSKATQYLENKQINNDKTKEVLQKFAQQFIEFI